MLMHDYDQYKMLKDGISVKSKIIKELKRELTDCRYQLNSALRYGFEKNKENMRLLKHRKGLEGKTREVM